MSDYYPSGTQYFYGYPAGEDSGFLNKVSPTVEELVAARIFSCAGSHVSVVSFAATSSPLVDPRLLDILDIPHSDSTNGIILPQSITVDVTGNSRDNAVKSALTETITPGSLVMAQPFIDDYMSGFYQISPQITMWLNDKSNLPELLGSEFLPARLASYDSGDDFSNDNSFKSTPCVVKVALSSSGDGVYICLNDDDLETTREQLKHLEAKIIVEQYIEVKNNYCINFGIPHNPAKSIDIVGFNEQLVATNGDFLGGMINTTELPDELTDIKRYMLDIALPKVRAMGWYGVGGLDVITDKTGKAYFIDGNFRMNGTSAYHFLVKNQIIKPPLVTFSGQFRGSRAAFEQAILPYAGKHADHRMIRLIALSRHGETWNLNGALMYKDATQLKHRINMLLAAGVQSSALQQLLDEE